MFAQTEIRSASSGIANRWPIEETLHRTATHVSAEEYRDALSRVASSVSVVTTNGPHGIADARRAANALSEQWPCRRPRHLPAFRVERILGSRDTGS